MTSVRYGTGHPAHRIASPVANATACRRMPLGRTPRPCARRTSGHRPMLPELRIGMQPWARDCAHGAHRVYRPRPAGGRRGRNGSRVHTPSVGWRVVHFRFVRPSSGESARPPPPMRQRRARGRHAADGAPGSLCRTSSTGRSAARSSDSATLPSSSLRRPCRPLVPITIRSASVSAAVRISTVATSSP